MWYPQHRSFLGLQYAALRSVDQLSANKAPGVRRFGVHLSGARQRSRDPAAKISYRR